MFRMSESGALVVVECCWKEERNADMVVGVGDGNFEYEYGRVVLSEPVFLVQNI